MQHVFISYVSENWTEVKKVYDVLKSHDLEVWIDRNDIKPGSRWKDAIRKAIRDGTFFIACFSKEYNKRNDTYMNEELTIAIEELRQRPTDRVWFIPVQLNKCKIPDRNIGAGETLHDLQHVKLYKDWDDGIQRIIEVIQSESPEPTRGEKASDEREINQSARTEFTKGLACQNSITETTPPEERSEKVQEAFYHYSKALEIEPNYVDALNARGGIYVFMDKHEDAIQDFNMALKLDPDYFAAYWNRGNIYHSKRMYKEAINDFSNIIKLKPSLAPPYLNRAVTYRLEGNFTQAIEDYNKAIELDPQLALAYYNRGEAWLHQREWEKARVDLITAKRIGMDVIAAFHDSYKNVETYEQRHRVKLPEDIALLLTQRRRTRYPKTQKVLDADGNPLESPNVVNLRAQLRNAGTPLGEYVKTKPGFGINTAPTEAFVVDKATRDKLIAAHPACADILKPFLHGQDLRRWHVSTQDQWLIFAHRGIAINDYPVILKHLEKYREPLRKRKGKQKWYELQVSHNDAERFSQPKLVCPDTYNHQTFAVDTAGYYYGKTSYLIPTEETWLCGLLNSRTVEWFYSQVSKQLTIDPLRARSGYIQRIPIPDLTSAHKALIAKLVYYLIYLQQQPTINSKDLVHARDRVMLGYFERIIDGLVYEAYLTEDLHKGDKHFFQPLLEEQLPSCEEIQGDKMPVLRDIFELLYERTHLVRRNLYYLDSVKAVRIIEDKI